jgi:hypothetical protein
MGHLVFVAMDVGPMEQADSELELGACCSFHYPLCTDIWGT